MPRYNKSPNPSAKYNLTGWLGFGTQTRLTGLSGPPRTTGTSVAMSSGAYSSSIGCAPAVVSSGQTWTGVGWVRSSVSRTVRIDLVRHINNVFVSATDPFDVALSANVWTQVRVTATLPSGTFNQLTWHADLPTSGSTGTLSVSSCRLEQVNDSSLVYGDGDSSSWDWDGTDGNSTSTLLDVRTVTITNGIGSAQAFGTPTVVAGARTLTATGIGSVEVFGSPTLEIGVVRPAGIGSLEMFGVPALAGSGVTITAVGVDSREAFGTPTMSTTLDPATQRARQRPPRRTYELVCVARVPQKVGPPLLVEVDAVEWTGLGYSDELSKSSRLNAGCKIANLPESVLQRIVDPLNLPTELRLNRNGKPVFAGPLLGAQPQGDSLSLQAVGLLGYMRFWFVTADLVFAQVDQFGIVTGLVDHWQNQAYGNYGIDTSGIGPSGVLRDATYLRNEGHPIGQRVEELGLRQGGFDIAIDPATRKLRLSYPLQGVDRSVGEDAVVFDARNVTSSNILISVAPGDVASDAFGVGTGGDRVYAATFDEELRARFGKAGVFSSFDGVSQQATIDAHVQGLLDARGRALVVPGPDARVTPDSDLSTYDVGDTVRYELHERLGLSGAFRLRKRTVTVSKTGVEAVSCEFV